MEYFVVFNLLNGKPLRFGQAESAQVPAESNLTEGEGILVMTNPDGSPLTSFSHVGENYLNIGTGKYYQLGVQPSPQHYYDHTQMIWINEDI